VLPQDVSIDELKTAISTSEGPVSQATQAEYVKFHDDKVRAPSELCGHFAGLLCGAYAIHCMADPSDCIRLIPFPEALRHRLLCWTQSTFTGVYARGGPTTVDGDKDLSQLCDRTPADARGVSSTSKFSRAR